MTDRDVVARVIELVERSCEEELSAAEASELERLVAESDAALEAYLDYTHLDSSLRFNVGETVGTPVAMEAPQSSNGWAAWLSRRATRTSLLAAAAVIALLLTAMYFMAPPFYRSITGIDDVTRGLDSKRVLARITGLRDVEWASSEASVRIGDGVREGQRLQLSGGLVQIAYHSGAVVLVEGPADFVVDDDNGGNLAFGRLFATVPNEAVGYAVRAPAAHFVDLGTEFGVAVSENGATTGAVYSGKVDLFTHDRGGKWERLRTLRAGDAVSIDSATGEVASIRSGSLQFRRSISVEQYKHGSPAAPREVVDGAPGVTPIYGVQFSTSGIAEEFVFYSDQAEGWVTPLLLAWEQEFERYRITAIGTSVQSDGTGVQSAEFVPLTGTAVVRAGTHTFGFFDGRVTRDDDGSVKTLSINAGVIALEPGGRWVYAFDEQPRSVVQGRSYGRTPAADELTWHDGRTYSAYMNVVTGRDLPNGDGDNTSLLP